MANSLSAVIPKLLAQGLMALRQQAIVSRIVNRDYDSLAAQKGATIDVPIPSTVTVGDVTPGATPPSTADQTPTVAQIQLTQWKEAAFHLSDKDLAEAMNGVIPMYASEAIKALANAVDSYVLGKYVGIYGYVGTAGTTPFATDVSPYTQSRTVLNRQLAGPDDRRVVLNPDAEGNVMLLRPFQDASFGGGNSIMSRGQIGSKMGVDWWMDQNIPTHTKGAAGTILVDDSGAIAAGVTTIHMDGFTTKASVGDIFTIAGDTQTYVVTAASNLVGTDSDVTFQPPLVVALPTGDNNEAVTFKATHVVNLSLHRDALALATRPLLDVTFNDARVDMQSAVDPVSGLTLRLEVTREHKRWRWAYDILFGAELVRPALAVRIAG